MSRQKKRIFNLRYIVVCLICKENYDAKKMCAVTKLKKKAQRFDNKIFQISNAKISRLINLITKTRWREWI